AEQELRAAVAWYEGQRPGLAANLLAEAQAVIRLIENSPGIARLLENPRSAYSGCKNRLLSPPYVIASFGACLHSPIKRPSGAMMKSSHRGLSAEGAQPLWILPITRMFFVVPRNPSHMN